VIVTLKRDPVCAARKDERECAVPKSKGAVPQRSGAVLGLALLALAGSACGSSHSFADPSCPAVLAQVSTVPPEGHKMANDELMDLQALVTPGTRLGALTDNVISALNGLRNATQPGSAAYRAAQEQYISDVVQVQRYCAH
jgi:hypothetical protein